MQLISPVIHSQSANPEIYIALQAFDVGPIET